MTIIITDEDVQRFLSMEECIEAMRVAFSDFADGKAANLPRMRYSVDTETLNKRYLANIQAGAVPSYGVAAVRAGSRFVKFEEVDGKQRVVHNPDPKNWTVIVLYDLDTAEPIAFLHENYISGIRVGATVGVAVQNLARENSEILGVFGSGAQAGPIVEAICSVRNIREVRVFSPTEKNREKFAEKYREKGLNIIALPNPSMIVPGADIIACATNAAEPVFDSEQLEHGQTLVTIVNSDVNGKRVEVDDGVFERASRVVINDWESVHANVQVELLEAIKQGVLREEEVNTLGDVVTKRAPGRTSSKEILYYKNNVGLGMQFAAAGGLIYKKMQGVSAKLEFPTDWLGSDAKS